MALVQLPKLQVFTRKMQINWGEFKEEKHKITGERDRLVRED